MDAQPSALSWLHPVAFPCQWHKHSKEFCRILDQGLGASAGFGVLKGLRWTNALYFPAPVPGRVSFVWNYPFLSLFSLFSAMNQENKYSELLEPEFKYPGPDICISSGPD